MLEAAFGFGSGVGLDTVELAVPVAPGTGRPVVQHVGVEVSKSQLPQIRSRPGATQVETGDHGARMDGAELQVRRHPAGALQVGPVAVFVVACQSVVHERLPKLARRALTGYNIERGTGIRDPALFDPQRRWIEPACGLGARFRRRPPADLAPLAEKRCEHEVGGAVLLCHAARRNQVRRARRNQRHRTERRTHPFVTALSERREIFGDMHRRGIDFLGNARNLPLGEPAGNE